LIINEAKNAAYERKNAKEANMKAIWKAIDRKQKELQANIFGELNDKLYDITQEKLNSMGEKYAFVPNVIARAGNSKLPASVLVINMSSSLMCPSYYLGICTIKNGACYAQRAENQYSSKDGVLPDRWKTDLMHTQMLQQYQNGNKQPMRDYFKLVETYIQLGNAYATNLYKEELEKVTYRLGRELTKEEKNILWMQQSEYVISDIRLNETGDFHCQLAVDLWAKFASKIKKKYGINTHAYTARNLDFSKASDVIAINPSHQGINMGENNTRMFKAVGNDFYNKLVGGDKVGNDRQPELGEINGKYFYKCPCKKGVTTCERCGVCFAPNKTGVDYTIYVRYHGLTAANGFKHLFTKNEVSNVIEKLHNNGWVTDEEYTTYQSQTNQNRLDKVSKDIKQQRSKDTTNKRKTKKTNK
jgi:hypothetical protein